jgi:hypothetical protein
MATTALGFNVPDPAAEKNSKGNSAQRKNRRTWLGARDLNWKGADKRKRRPGKKPGRRSLKH